MQPILCPLCRQNDTLPVWRKTYGDLQVTTVLCRSCGLVYHNPVVQDSDRERLGLTHRQLHTNEAINQRHRRRVQQRVDRQTDFLAPIIRPSWQTLEIGCGLGVFSDWLHRQGCEVVGIEPDSQQAAYAREHYGIEVINDRFEEIAITSGFDFIASSHVIEHFPAPLAFLQKVRSLAKPEAWLFLETPNILAPKVGPRRVFSLPHNYYFSPQTLTALLAQAGWHVEKMRVFRRDSFQLVARTAPAQPAVTDGLHAREVLQAIRRHRWVYYLYLLFLWRKIPLWQRKWMYRFQDYLS
ncbi:class I SAM-dependent methyltransferase [Desulfobacca acetoxidans]|uniref:Methyltransferase type 12 n=1 Tax=Desulfobacca acetoxidans (strain ATCC 700848 / DSM 11109 / ASRB2) TaxID=880072 RepID=F2NET4_DESAR|nr:class I SAM-dependent methyltransferase [Desulfobacca acetoxidans]AEB08274.1 Methyltransferase type 12 [Desulfobacca acetoxidans DSM 11109]